MPSPKSGTAQQLVAPAPPRASLDADDADPGKVDAVKAAQQQSGTGKYGAQPVKPYRPAPPGATASASATGKSDPPSAAKPKSWVEVQLLDEAGQPVTGQAYRITLADGTVDEGTLDEAGLVRLDGIDPGSCTLTFPNLDQDAWTQG